MRVGSLSASRAETSLARPLRLQHHASRIVARPAASSSSDPSDSAAASTSEQRRETMEKVPISALDKPNPKAMQKLNASMQKTGVNKLLVDTLSGTSFAIVGDDDALTWAFAENLAERLGFFACSTAKVVAGIMKCKPEELSKQDPAKRAAAETSVLLGLRTQRRVVVQTMAGGAASIPDSYKHLFGSIIIRVDEDSKITPKPDTAERACHSKMAEVDMQIWKPQGFSNAGSSPGIKAKNNENALVEKIIGFLNSNKGDAEKGEFGIIEKKAHYISRGCRGDWPELMPPEWTPEK